MRKIFFVILLILAMQLAFVGVATADGGPHGGYTATTDACAGCHRAHTASGPKLLVSNSTYALCITCHGNTGTGANTNVDSGVYLATRDDTGSNEDHGAANTPTNASLLGGGFVYYNGMPVTSTHDPTGVTAAAWGNGVDRGETADLVGGNLSCASCHDPHGNNNYRILNSVVNGKDVAVPQVDEGELKDYDTEQWGAGLSSFCAACHSAYYVTEAGQGSVVDGTTFTHRIDMNYSYRGNLNPETIGLSGYKLPLAESSIKDTVVCMTCHLPHGSSAVMTGLADHGGLPGNTAATDSALLRLPNRGVCEVCHQK